MHCNQIQMSCKIGYSAMYRDVLIYKNAIVLHHYVLLFRFLNVLTKLCLQSSAYINAAAKDFRQSSYSWRFLLSSPIIR